MKTKTKQRRNEIGIFFNKPSDSAEDADSSYDKDGEPSTYGSRSKSIPISSYVVDDEALDAQISWCLNIV